MEEVRVDQAVRVPTTSSSNQCLHQERKSDSNIQTIYVSKAFKGWVDRTHNGWITFDECLDALKKVKFECHGRQLITDIIFNQLFGDTTDVVTTEEIMEKFLRQKQQEHNATIENTRHAVWIGKIVGGSKV